MPSIANRMLRIILKILTFTLLLIVNPAYTQKIWQENFLIPGKGIWGNENGTIQSDFSGIETWTLDTAGINLDGPDDYAKTVSTSGGRFECRDIDGEVIWRSEQIDISSYNKINIRLTAYETGSGNNTSNKYLKAFYRLNEGNEIAFDTYGVNLGNWGSANAEQHELEGESLQIICYIKNHYANDKVTLDEVIVREKEKTMPPIIRNDIIINEILFNPYPEGEDFIEIYNRSDKTISANCLFLANRDKNMELTRIYQLLKSKYLFQPGSYLAITKNIEDISLWYEIKCPSCLLQVNKMPRYNNKEGYVVLLNEKMEIIDELYYNEDMHSPFLRDPEGISLERISFFAPTNKYGNWKSASSMSGYGTPGYENSQACDDSLLSPQLIIEPAAFSPNYDGYNDQLLIHYQMNQKNYSATIKLFDTYGRYVLTLLNNEMPGMKGTIKWNGEDETGQLQKPGIYIIIAEIISDKGTVHRFKDAVVLTGKSE